MSKNIKSSIGQQKCRTYRYVKTENVFLLIFFDVGISKEAAAQLSGCSRVKDQSSNLRKMAENTIVLNTDRIDKEGKRAKVPPEKTLEQGRDASWWLASLLFLFYQCLTQLCFLPFF